MFRTLVTAAATAIGMAAPLAAEPIKFAMTDIEGLEALQQEFAAFEGALEELTGLELERFPVSSRTSAVEALIRGNVQAVGMNESHLRRIREAFPEQSFTVVARGRDLPNDILVARKDMDAEALQKIANAFLNDSETLMATVLKGEDNRKYEGGFFLIKVDDADYDYVRDMYKTIGVDTSSFVGDWSHPCGRHRERHPAAPCHSGQWSPPVQDVMEQVRLGAEIPTPAPETGEPLVVSDGLWKSYNRGTPVLQGIGLTIRQGERVALLFVATVGLGAVAGTMTIVVDTIGFCDRFLGEAMEDAEKELRKRSWPSAQGACRSSLARSCTMPRPR